MTVPPSEKTCGKCERFHGQVITRDLAGPEKPVCDLFHHGIPSSIWEGRIHCVSRIKKEAKNGSGV